MSLKQSLRLELPKRNLEPAPVINLARDNEALLAYIHCHDVLKWTGGVGGERGRGEVQGEGGGGERNLRRGVSVTAIYVHAREKYPSAKLGFHCLAEDNARFVTAWLEVGVLNCLRNFRVYRLTYV